MEKKKSFYKIPLIQISNTVLILCIIALAFFGITLNRMSQKVETFIQKDCTICDPSKKISVVYFIPQDKKWTQPDGSIGAQYDGIIFNNTNHPFVDWKMKIYLTEQYIIDSWWNASYSFYYTDFEPISPKNSWKPEYMNQFEASDNYAIAEQNGDPNLVVNGQKSRYKRELSLGWIMYTKDHFSIKRIEIEGRFIYSPWENPVFIGLLIFTLVVFIFTCVLIVIEQVVAFRLKAYKDKQKASNAIIIQSFKTFANFVDAKDPYTKGHSLRVAWYAKEIARRIGLEEQAQMEIFWEGLMHDVGKISIRDEILNKPSKLTPEEYNEIKTHPSKGYDILKDFTQMPMLKEVANSHHEHWDGTGHPEKLSETEIPLEARIVCVCDCFDAMNSDRCYRPRLSKERIIEEFTKASGKIFDPELVPVLLDMIHDGFTDDNEGIDFQNKISNSI